MPASKHKQIHIITLRQTIPDVFAGGLNATSDIWDKELRFEKGKSYLVEAASGTGKSSLCSFIYGQRKDYQGTICFDETDISSYSISQWTVLRQRSISLLFQDLRLFPELTALENVLIKNHQTGFKPQHDIELMFESLGIADKRHQQVEKLSFGQQQRVAFIRALCQPFDFILLDEPISHLDEENGENFARLLTTEAGQQEAGVIVTSIGKHLNLTYDTIFRL